MKKQKQKNEKKHTKKTENMDFSAERHRDTHPRGCFNLNDHVIHRNHSLNSGSRRLSGTFLVYTWLHLKKTEQTMFGIFALSY